MQSRAIQVLSAALLCGLTGHAFGGLTLLSGASPLSHAGNLVTNGSFEVGAPSPGSSIFWANPSFPGNAVPAGWAATGQASTYATWGSDPTPGTGLRGSALLPDGNAGLYFGNQFTDVSVAPVQHPDGTVTFASAPTFTPAFGGPCTLTQTVNTQLTPSAAYRISFWVSGEDAGVAGNGWQRGVMGFQMTNVLSGDPIQYLSVPSGTGTIHSRVYTFQFSPINASLPVDITFINWGHVASIGGVPSGLATELVLDDVIINPVAAPAPGGMALLGVCGLALRRRRA
ncbi:MAG: hypothetical protein WC718_07535 [Phycisphaerales bacterium]|jgi:MYXO-CTERM domain-containing protein